MMQNEEKKRFFQILNKDNKFKNSPLKYKVDIVNQLENGCFKLSYSEAVKHRIHINWTSEGFLVIYNKYCYIVKLHIDKDSEIKSSKILEEIHKYIDILTMDNLYRKVIINLKFKNTSLPTIIENKVKEKIYSYLQPKSVVYPYYIPEMEVKCMSDNLLETMDMIHNHHAEKVEEKYTSLRSCPKCKQNKAKYIEVQLRSFDEGMSLYLVCCNCNWNWIVS